MIKKGSEVVISSQCKRKSSFFSVVVNSGFARVLILDDFFFLPRIRKRKRIRRRFGLRYLSSRLAITYKIATIFKIPMHDTLFKYRILCFLVPPFHSELLS